MKEMNILIQTEDESLLRDGHSKALLNKNITALKEYKNKKNMFQKLKENEQENKKRIENLEKNMEEIKFLLQEIAKIREPNGN